MLGRFQKRVQGSLFVTLDIGDSGVGGRAAVDQDHIVAVGGYLGGGFHAGHAGTDHQNVGRQLDGFHLRLLCHEALPRYFITSPAD